MLDKEYEEWVDEQEERLSGHEREQGVNRKGDD